MLRASTITKGGLFLAVILFGYAAITLGPSLLLLNTEQMLAAVGATVAVAPNPYNTVAAQLTQKQKDLEAREALLISRESKGGDQVLGHSYGFWSLCASTLLFMLVLINFFFDLHRKVIPK